MFSCIQSSPRPTELRIIILQLMENARSQSTCQYYEVLNGRDRTGTQSGLNPKCELILSTPLPL